MHPIGYYLSAVGKRKLYAPPSIGVACYPGNGKISNACNLGLLDHIFYKFEEKQIFFLTCEIVCFQIVRFPKNDKMPRCMPIRKVFLH